MVRLDRLLETAIRLHAGTIRLRAGEPPTLSLDEGPRALEIPPLTSAAIGEIAGKLLPQRQRAALDRGGDATVAFKLGQTGQVLLHVWPTRGVFAADIHIMDATD